MSRKWVTSHAIFALHCHVSDSTAVSNPFPTGDRNFNLRFCVRDLRVVFFNFHSFFFTRGEQGEFRGFRPGVLENKHSLVSRPPTAQQVDLGTRCKKLPKVKHNFKENTFIF